MDGSAENNYIDTVSLHFTNGNSVLYTNKELVRLTKDVTLGISLDFAVVNFTNTASPIIIHDIQEIFKLLGLKL